MGVTGLWSLVEPTGKPIRIQSLRGKVLAVDVSIWLHQSVKGFRDREGNSIPNAHLLGVFHRVCKLLSYGIKPIFVFDGGVPALKKQTMTLRKHRKIEALDKSELARRKLLTNLLKQQIQRQLATTLPPELLDAEVDRIMSSQKGETGHHHSSKKQSKNSTLNSSVESQSPLKFNKITGSPIKSKTNKDGGFEDDFEKFREKLADNFNNFSVFFNELDATQGDTSDLEDDSEYGTSYGCNYDDHFSNIISPTFDELPLETQHEMLFEMQESKKNNSWGKIDQMPKELQNFSSFQMERLRKRWTLQKKIQSVQQEMGNRHIHLSNYDDLAAYNYENVPNAKSDDILASKERGMIYVKSTASSSTSSAASQNKQPTTMIPSVESQKQDKFELMEVAGPSSSSSFRKKENSPATTISIDDYVVDWSSSSDNEDQKDNNVEEDLTEAEQLEKAIKLSLATDDDAAATDDDEIKEVVKEVLVDDVQNVESQSSEPVVFASPPKVLTVQDNDNAKVIEKVVTISSDSDSDFEDVQEEAAEPVTNEVKLPQIVNKPVVPVIKIQFDPNKPLLTDDDDIFADVFKQPLVDDKINKDKVSSTEEKTEELAVALKNFVSENEKVLVGANKVSECDWEVPDFSKEDDGDDDDDIEMVDVPEIPSSVGAGQHQQIARTLGMDPTKKKSAQLLTAQYLQNQQKLNTEKEKLQSSKGAQERIATTITDQMYAEAQELLALFGVPYIISPMEAESQCAFLDTACLTDGSITDDSDIWLFGAQRVYKNFFSQGDRSLELFEYADIVRTLNLDREKMILIAILTGSDYTNGVEGVGPVRALEIISEFITPTMDNVFDALIKFREWWEKAKEDKQFDAKNKIRNKFRNIKLHPGFPSRTVYEAYTEPTIDKSTEPFRWGSPDLDALRTYTKGKFGWNQQKCDASLLPLLKDLRCQAEEASRQLTMDSFVTIVGGKGSKTSSLSSRRKIKSKRLQVAMKKLKNGGEAKLSSEDSDLEEVDQSGSDPELDGLLEKMGVKKVKFTRQESMRTTNTPGPSTAAASRQKPGGRGGKRRPVKKPRPELDEEIPRAPPVGAILTPTKKAPTVIPQTARAEFQKKMSKKKAIELFKQKKEERK